MAPFLLTNGCIKNPLIQIKKSPKTSINQTILKKVTNIKKMLKAFKLLTLLLSTVTCIKHNFCQFRNCHHVICGFQRDDLHHNIIASDFDIETDKGVVIYPLTPYIVNLILSEINSRRSILACRRHQFLDPTEKELFIYANMYEIKWDWDLSYLSRVFASKCLLGSATCSSVNHFPKPGVLHTFSKQLNVGKFIRQSIEEWWSLGDLWYWDNPIDPEHTFNLLALGNQTHMGCAISLCKGASQKRLFIYCHFSTTSYRHIGKHSDGLVHCHKQSTEYHGLCENPGYIQ